MTTARRSSSNETLFSNCLNDSVARSWNVKGSCCACLYSHGMSNPSLNDDAMCTNPMPPKFPFASYLPQVDETMDSSMVMQHWPPSQHFSSGLLSTGDGESARRFCGCEYTVGMPSSLKHPAPCGSSAGSRRVRHAWCTIILEVESPRRKTFALSRTDLSARDEISTSPGWRSRHWHSSPMAPQLLWRKSGSHCGANVLNGSGVAGAPHAPSADSD
mmetsp:Transcript_2194/g.9990  ORF Transcript_2194/g.9990 Transcript_2194/m.9990 type:complete len:216 (+) Transcript_2194:470-1117(+)